MLRKSKYNVKFLFDSESVFRYILPSWPFILSLMSDKKSPFAFLKTPVLSGLAFVFTVVTVSVGYAAWTALDRNAAATGQTVTSSLMQAVIDDVNDLNSRVSNFSFSGGNVGIGTASPSRELHIFADNYATATIETN